MYDFLPELFKRHLTKEIGVALAVVSGIGAVLLAIFVKYHPTDRMDIFISGEVQEEGGKRFLSLMRMVSFFGTPYIAVCAAIIAAGIFFIFSYRREAFFLLLTPLSGVVDGLIKIAVNRPRPTAALVTVYQALTDPSYPSGHVVYYVVFFGFLIATMFVIKKAPVVLRISVVAISAMLIALVSVSRVYLGVHWATDVLGGYFTGYVLLFMLASLYFRNLDTVRYEPSRAQLLP